MRKTKDSFILLFVLLIGLVLGGLIGQLLSSTMPILSYGKSLGMTPATLDLGAIAITFGFNLYINVASIIGVLIAFFLFRKL